MASPYTKRVVAARLDTVGAQLVYTHSGPSVLVLRDILVGNLHTASQSTRVFLSTGGQNFDLMRNPAQASLTVDHLDLRQEVKAGEQLSIQNGAGPMTVLITGYYLNP